MASPTDFDKGGVYLFFFVFSIIAALIGLIKGARCGSWHCSFIFLGLALFLFIAAMQKIFS